MLDTGTALSGRVLHVKLCTTAVLSGAGVAASGLVGGAKLCKARQKELPVAKPDSTAGRDTCCAHATSDAPSQGRPCAAAVTPCRAVQTVCGL